MPVATAITRPAVLVEGPASGGGATRVVVAVLGTLVGLAGVEHGVGEVLQGPVRPEGWSSCLGRTRPVRVTGTHKHEFMGIEATGLTIDWELVDIVAFNDRGEVTEHCGYADNLTLLQQLGAVPEHLLPTG